MKIRNILTLTAIFLLNFAYGDEKVTPKEDKRYVFAHYMTCFSASPEFYTREIKLAQQYGIDGFALNCGEWMAPGKDGKNKRTRYVRNAENLFEQAKQLDSGFTLFMSPDFAGGAIKKWTMLNLIDMYKRFEKHPNIFRYRGKPFFSGYSGKPEQYAPPIKQMRKDGHDFWLVPKASTPGWKMGWSMESTLHLLGDDSPFDGLFNFACDGTTRNIISNNSIGRRATLMEDKIYMAGVCPAYNSPNLRDFRGVSGYSAQWDALINDGADLVEIVTWNDYAEDSNLMPFRWYHSKSGKAVNKEYFDRDESYLDVTSYYIKKYKNKKAPEITQDRMYFTYRNRSKDKVKLWDRKTKKWVDLRFTKHPYDQIHDDVRDSIYVTIFLTEDADLTVKTGSKSKEFKMTKGISHCEVPFDPGTPQFILKRNGKDIINVYGRKEIIDKVTKENSTKGYHLANRTWTTGAIAGTPFKTINLPGNGVKIGPENKEFEAKVSGIDSSPYNFRITYKNTNPTESRLTLYCDGAPDAEGRQLFYFPLFLPPTGGEFRTVSFIWTIWKNTSKLKICFDESTDDKDLIGKGHNDIGSATIKTIELIKVKPFKAIESNLTIPELVEIPEGSFSMGSNSTEYDEAPAHKVNISKFAIGKYEVSNEEFEQFRPEHKKHRDGFSWRDKEAVIYVSWKDAASYCNWLSEKYGLEKVYDEKSWSMNRKANGFRLPTEAEWEYAATGRGENRIYPWGNEAPAPDKGNFMLEKSLETDPLLPATTQKGVMIVGRYPKGASRDGVMDMAGNVTEWCSDYFNPYTPEEKTDPCDQKKSNHRGT